MAVTDDAALADRMRMMSLHGLSHDAWDRYSGGGSWDYRIVEAGYKYNLTDMAAAIGVHQLARAEAMRRRARSDRPPLSARNWPTWPNSNCRPCPRIAFTPGTCFRSGCGWTSCRSTATRSSTQLRAAGVGCSVHWRPLHLHPYYARAVRLDGRAISRGLAAVGAVGQPAAVSGHARRRASPRGPGGPRLVRAESRMNSNAEVRGVDQLPGPVAPVHRPVYAVAQAIVRIVMAAAWAGARQSAFGLGGDRGAARFGRPDLLSPERVGRNFRPFSIYKFRTMIVDAPSRGGQITAGADPRITRVGRWLRKSKIDELPQLFNVLRGRHEPGGSAARGAQVRRDVPRRVRRRALGAAGPDRSGRRSSIATKRSCWPPAPIPSRNTSQRILPDKIALAARLHRPGDLRQRSGRHLLRTLLRIAR